MRSTERRSALIAMLPFMFLMTIGACSSMFTSAKNL